MKKTIFSILFVVAAMGFAGTGYMSMKKPAVAASSAAEEDKDGQGSTRSFLSISLKPLHVPIVRGDDLVQIVHMSVALEVKNDRDYIRVRDMEPKLVDAYLLELNEIFNDPRLAKGAVLNITKIKKRLQAVSNRIMDDDEIVKAVLLETVHQSKPDEE